MDDIKSSLLRVVNTTFGAGDVRPPFGSNRGAMFGMDARVALVIASVLAAAGTVSVMSKLDRNRVSAAEHGVQLFQTALTNYYKTINLKGLPKEMDELFNAGVVDDVSLKEDPWGNKWYYNTTSREITLDNMPVTVHYAIIYSSGKDGINNSPAVSTAAEWNGWAPQGDDIGNKFSTIEIEKERIANFQQQGSLIVNKLDELEQSRYVEMDTICTATPEYPQCSVTGPDGKVITYQNYNFYPRSNLDTTRNAFYYSTEVMGEPVFISGNKESMEQMMALLKLPAYFATNPWGEVLTYHSNIYERPIAPFRAQIWLPTR